MASTNLRGLSSISRLLLPNGSKAFPAMVAKATAVPAKHHYTQTRDLHSTNLNYHTIVKTTFPQSATPPPAESGFRLAELKVFQDEQVVQLTFKSGTSVNYTMNWLRNLCSCPECISNKFLTNPNHKPQPTQSISTNVDGQLSVTRFYSTEDELTIEWLTTTDYKSHVSKYNLQFLSLHAN